tara:strand:- start:45 stop:314 length:270 start_codon:yes stop_codon:yes gene_type:complete
MTIEYRNPVASSVINDFSGAENVVVQVSMTCFNTETGNFAPFTIAWDMDAFDPSSGFTPLEDVTDEQLITWAKNGAGADMISDLEASVS